MLHLLPITPLKCKSLKLDGLELNIFFHAKSCASLRRITVEKGFDCGLFFYPQDVMLWTVHVLGDVYRIGGRPFLIGSPEKGGTL